MKGTLFLTYETNDLKLVRLSFTFDVLGIRKRSKLNFYKRPISSTVTHKNLRKKYFMKTTNSLYCLYLMEIFSSRPGCLVI
jgi:hypothetical protein